MLHNNKFITFEGGEGCGKSTQSRMLYNYFLQQKVEAILTREIGGTTEAEEIRKIVLYSDLLPLSELMLIMAARYEHIQKIISPALKQKRWVICDRFIDSTVCYQGIAQGIGQNRIYQLHYDIVTSLMPDITFFLDIPPEKALNRTKARAENNKFEERDLDFHQRIYEAFQALAKQFQDRIIRVEVQDLTEIQIHQRIIDILNRKN